MSDSKHLIPHHIPEEVQARFSVSGAQINKSTFSIGPTYNKIGPVGYPILGVSLKTNDEIFQLSSTIEADAYVPQTGAQLFQGLTAHNDGTIDFHTSSSDGKPALLLKEDYFTLLSLAFLEASPPKFNLENLIDLHTSDRLVISEKQWEPNWVEFSNFGKTLYYTDRLLGDLFFNSQSSWTFYPKGRSRAERFLMALDEAATKRDRFFQRGRKFGIHLVSGVGSGYRRITVEKGVTIIPSKENPRISGWPPGAWRKRNDSRFSDGSFANFMTDHYDELCELLPVYERYRQLMRVWVSLCLVRLDHFQLNDEWIGKLRTFVAHRQEQVVAGNHGRIIDFTPIGRR